jgi:hypothetical protein
VALQHFANLMKGSSPKVFGESVNESRRGISVVWPDNRNGSDTVSLIQKYLRKFADDNYRRQYDRMIGIIILNDRYNYNALPPYARIGACNGNVVTTASAQGKTRDSPGLVGAKLRSGLGTGNSRHWPRRCTNLAPMGLVPAIPIIGHYAGSAPPDRRVGGSGANVVRRDLTP